MKVSFDGLRKNIAADFNALVEEIVEQDTKLGQGACLNLSEEINRLRCSLDALMSCLKAENIQRNYC